VAASLPGYLSCTPFVLDGTAAHSRDGAITTRRLGSLPGCTSVMDHVGTNIFSFMKQPLDAGALWTLRLSP
jgi:hypothetical protein